MSILFLHLANLGYAPYVRDDNFNGGIEYEIDLCSHYTRLCTRLLMVNHISYFEFSCMQVMTLAHIDS